MRTLLARSVLAATAGILLAVVAAGITTSVLVSRDEHHALLKTVALITLGVFVIAASSYAAGLSSRRLARWAGNLSARMVSWGLRIFRRGPVSWTGETFAGFRAQAVGLLRRRWLFLTDATLAGQLTVFLVLLVVPIIENFQERRIAMRSANILRRAGIFPGNADW